MPSKKHHKSTKLNFPMSGYLRVRDFVVTGAAVVAVGAVTSTSLTSFDSKIFTSPATAGMALGATYGIIFVTHVVLDKFGLGKVLSV